MVHILVVDDQLLFRRALCFMLEGNPEFVIVGEAENGAKALIQVGELQPDVVLMDLQMPVMGGVAATRQICQQYPATKVLILTMDDRDQEVLQALKYGAVGYLLKNAPPDDLAIAIQSANKGYLHLYPSVGQKLVAKIPEINPEPIPHLTPREQEILMLIAQGTSNRDIARELCLSEKTVKNHITRILQRLNLESRTQAAVYAISKLGWER